MKRRSKLLRIHHWGNFIRNHIKLVKGYSEFLVEEVKIDKSEVFDYEKLVAVIHDLGYTDFSVLYKLWNKNYDWMGAVKCDKGLKNVLVSNNEKPVDLYVVES